MQNITRTLHKSGTKLSIAGPTRQAVEREVNRLFNVAAITGYPGEDIGEAEILQETEGRFSIYCSTYKKRFLRGLLTLAEIDLQRSAMVLHTMRPAKQKDAARLTARAIVRAAHIYRHEFIIGSEKVKGKREKDYVLSAQERRDTAALRCDLFGTRS